MASIDTNDITIIIENLIQKYSESVKGDIIYNEVVEKINKINSEYINSSSNHFVKMTTPEILKNLYLTKLAKAAAINQKSFELATDTANMITDEKTREKTIEFINQLNPNSSFFTCSFFH